MATLLLLQLWRTRSLREEGLNCIGLTSKVLLRLDFQSAGLPAYFTTTAKTILAGTRYFTAAEIGQMILSTSSGVE